MADSLAKRRTTLSVSREERLTRQFYDWERRGRGWQVCEYPVELEPPFRPVIYYDSVPETYTDDGRIATFFSRLFGGDQGAATSRQPAEPSEAEFLEHLARLDEPEVCGHYEDEYRELEMILPKDQRVAKPFVDRLVTSATYCTRPVAFEVVGTPDRITVQMCATERDLPQLRTQLAAYFPEARFQESVDDYLAYAWGDAEGHSQIVDFGLSDEFMIPLEPVSNLELDPLISVVGALNELRSGEIGVFQILFQKTRADWGREIMDAMVLGNGKPVFSDAPELPKQASRKITSQLYAAVVRVAAKARGVERLWQIVRGAASGMAQLSTPMSNELIPLSNEAYDRDDHERALLQRHSFRVGMILNLDELVSLVHPPTVSVRSDRLVRDTEDTKAPA